MARKNRQLENRNVTSSDCLRRSLLRHKTKFTVRCVAPYWLHCVIIVRYAAVSMLSVCPACRSHHTTSQHTTPYHTTHITHTHHTISHHITSLLPQVTLHCLLSVWPCRIFCNCLVIGTIFGGGAGVSYLQCVFLFSTTFVSVTLLFVISGR
jgi:hypothetical protein